MRLVLDRAWFWYYNFKFRCNAGDCSDTTRNTFFCSRIIHTDVIIDPNLVIAHDSIPWPVPTQLQQRRKILTSAYQKYLVLTIFTVIDYYQDDSVPRPIPKSIPVYFLLIHLFLVLLLQCYRLFRDYLHWVRHLQSFGNYHSQDYSTCWRATHFRNHQVAGTSESAGGGSRQRKTHRGRDWCGPRVRREDWGRVREEGRRGLMGEMIKSMTAEEKRWWKR